ncbi:hypothetical protein [Cellulomonas fimi]|uniref:Uncharacterized protein n=1 Tax=Cellulomonas fimi TaxID=1708 RepID=A0A7Y0LWW8_CELFI|nr:hypothetical protein [Cellulomonas fimi]NMR19475.1 hypothetical protein [Cellulomonas fimi]
MIALVQVCVQSVGGGDRPASAASVSVQNDAMGVGVVPDAPAAADPQGDPSKALGACLVALTGVVLAILARRAPEPRLLVLARVVVRRARAVVRALQAPLIALTPHRLCVIRT